MNSPNTDGTNDERLEQYYHNRLKTLTMISKWTPHERDRTIHGMKMWDEVFEECYGIKMQKWEWDNDAGTIRYITG